MLRIGEFGLHYSLKVLRVRDYKIQLNKKSFTARDIGLQQNVTVLKG